MLCQFIKTSRQVTASGLALSAPLDSALDIGTVLDSEIGKLQQPGLKTLNTDGTISVVAPASNAGAVPTMPVYATLQGDGAISDGTHGKRGGGDLHAAATATSGGFMPPAMFAKVQGSNLSAFASGNAPITALALGDTDIPVTISPAMPSADYIAVVSIEGTSAGLGKVAPRVKSKTTSIVVVTLSATVAATVSGTVNVAAFVKA